MHQDTMLHETEASSKKPHEKKPKEMTKIQTKQQQKKSSLIISNTKLLNINNDEVNLLRNKTSFLKKEDEFQSNGKLIFY